MRIGILGSGFMGGTHARAYAKIPGVEVAAVSSLHLEKAEKLVLRECGYDSSRHRGTVVCASARQWPRRTRPDEDRRSAIRPVAAGG